MRELGNVAHARATGALFVYAYLLTTAASSELKAQHASVATAIYQVGDKPLSKWRIESSPMLRIDGNKVELVDVNGVIRLSSGIIAVASNSSNNIRIFSGTGKLIKTLGRFGSGPGEFAGLWGIWRVRDTLIAYDARGIAQVSAPNGQFVRTERGRPQGPLGERAERSGYFADGTVLMQTEANREKREPGKWETGYFKLFVPPAKVLGKYPASDLRSDAAGREEGQVYGARAMVAVLSSSFCVGRSSAYAFECFDESGKATLKVQRRSETPRAVSSADREIYFHGIDVANPLPRQAAYRERVRRSTQFADHLPYFGRMIASTSDEIWIGPLNPADETLGPFSPVPDAATEWSVFSRGGRWLSTVTLPKRFRFMEAGADYVAGISRNSDDVESVVVYPLRK